MMDTLKEQKNEKQNRIELDDENIKYLKEIQLKQILLLLIKE